MLFWNLEKQNKTLYTFFFLLLAIVLFTISLSPKQFTINNNSNRCRSVGRNGDSTPPTFESVWIIPETPEEGDYVTAWAIVHDESGIQAVFCRSRILNDENYQFTTFNYSMTSTDNVTFSCNIGIVHNGTSYYLQFSATDASLNHNNGLGSGLSFSINFKPMPGVYQLPVPGYVIILGIIIIIVIVVIMYNFSKHEKEEPI